MLNKTAIDSVFPRDRIKALPLRHKYDRPGALCGAAIRVPRQNFLPPYSLRSQGINKNAHPNVWVWVKELDCGRYIFVMLYVSLLPPYCVC